MKLMNTSKNGNELRLIVYGAFGKAFSIYTEIKRIFVSDTFTNF